MACNLPSQELSCDYLYALRASRISWKVNDVHLVYNLPTFGQGCVFREFVSDSCCVYDSDKLALHVSNEMIRRYGKDKKRRRLEVCILIILLIVVSCSLYY